jgi:ribosome-associated protein
LDLRGVSDFTDFFVLATGTSDRMLSSLVESAEEKGKTEGMGNPYVEGLPLSGWMVMDYGSVVVHLFSPEKREYYQLEELWKAGKIVLRLK